MREVQRRREVTPGGEHKAALFKAWVRQAQRRALTLTLPPREEVEVEGARPPAQLTGALKAKLNLKQRLK